MTGGAVTGGTTAATGGIVTNTNASAQAGSSGGQSGAEEDGAGTLALAGTLTGGKFTFKVITPKKTLLLCAPSEEEEVKWIGAIRVLIARRTSAEAGCSGHVQMASGSGSGSGGGEVHKKKEGKEREKEKEKEYEKEKEAAGTSGARKRSISATGPATGVLGGGDKEK